MKTDVCEDEKGYELDVDLPGFKKDEISLEVKDGRVLRQERYTGVCSRSFYVGNVKPEDVKAKYESGVLSIALPKGTPKKLPSSSTVTIE